MCSIFFSMCHGNPWHWPHWLANSKTLQVQASLSRQLRGRETRGQFKPLAIKNKSMACFYIALNDTFLLKVKEEVSVWMWCLLRGMPARRGRLPLSSPPPRFLLCFYNLWLEAVQHSILSSVAVAVVQRGSRNNCVPCRGCLNCWNKLLSPPTHHLQHTCTLSPSSHLTQTIPRGGLSVRNTEEHAIYLGNNHHKTSHRQTMKSEIPWVIWSLLGCSSF